jgi:hypothetical protein
MGHQKKKKTAADTNAQPTTNKTKAPPTAGEQPAANEANAQPTAGEQPAANEANAQPTAGEQPAANEANAQPTAGEEPTAGDPSPDELLLLQQLLNNLDKDLLTAADIRILRNTKKQWNFTPEAERIFQLLCDTAVKTDDALGRANKKYGDLHSGTRAFMQAGEALKKEHAELTRTVSAFRKKYSDLLTEVTNQRQDKGDHLAASEEHDQLKEKLALLEKEHRRLQKILANKQVTDDSHKSSATIPGASPSSATSTEPPVNDLHSFIQSIILDKLRQATDEHSRLSAHLDAFTAQKNIIVQKLSSASAADSRKLADELTQVLHDHMLAELQLAEVAKAIAAFTIVNIPLLMNACEKLINEALPTAMPAPTAAAAASTVAPTPAATAMVDASTVAPTPAPTAAVAASTAAVAASTAAVAASTAAVAASTAAVAASTAASTPAATAAPLYKMALEKPLKK